MLNISDIDINTLISILLKYEIFVIYYIFIANSSYLIILIFAYINARSQYLEKNLNMVEKLSPLKTLKPISILVPCYNEEKTIKESLSSTLRIDYPEFEVIVCNDGSTDNTLKVLIEEFSLKPATSYSLKILPSQEIQRIYRSRLFSNLIVIDKANGGKSDALNASINFSQYPLICCVDSDSVLDADGLKRASLPFFIEPEKTIATGGTIFIANTVEAKKKGERVNTAIPNSLLSMVQALEYVRAFLVGRIGWDYIGGNTIISGAFGLFRKETVIQAGGYAQNTIGEDMELLLRMISYKVHEKENYEVKFLPDPTCWTEAPSDFKTLGNQRSRWQQGLCESLWYHKRLFFSKRNFTVGYIALPYQLLFEIISGPLEIIGFFIALISLWLNLLPPHIVILFLMVSIVYGLLLSLGAILIEQLTFKKYSGLGDTVKLLIGALLEQFGYRQIHLFWRIRGIIRWLRGKSHWGKMKRSGFK